MASMVRSSVLQQARLLASPQGRLFTPRVAGALYSTQCRGPSTYRQSFVEKSNVAQKIPKAAFHASAKRLILPPPPQRIAGTANDPVPLMEPSPTHGSYHWTFERLVAVGIIPLTFAPFAAGSLSPLMDSILCGTIIIHSYIGFQACIVDYFPKYRVPKTHAFFWWVLRGSTVLVAVAFYEFETNDVGLTEAIRRIWTA